MGSYIDTASLGHSPAYIYGDVRPTGEYILKLITPPASSAMETGSNLILSGLGYRMRRLLGLFISYTTGPLVYKVEAVSAFLYNEGCNVVVFYP